MAIAMHGPAFTDDGPVGPVVNRDVPEADLKAYLDAGYKLGSMPGNVAPSTALPPEPSAPAKSGK